MKAFVGFRNGKWVELTNEDIERVEKPKSVMDEVWQEIAKKKAEQLRNAPNK